MHEQPPQPSEPLGQPDVAAEPQGPLPPDVQGSEQQSQQPEQAPDVPVVAQLRAAIEALRDKRAQLIKDDDQDGLAELRSQLAELEQEYAELRFGEGGIGML